jgi:hypothetical protein
MVCLDVEEDGSGGMIDGNRGVVGVVTDGVGEGDSSNSSNSNT